MEGLKTFIVILFFGKSILLTPHGINLSTAWQSVPLESRISAITPGAALYIDVTRAANNERNYSSLKRMFPSGSLEAKLITENGREIPLHYKEGISFSKKTVSLILDSESMPTNIQFARLLVRSNQPLKDVRIVWQNFSK